MVSHSFRNAAVGLLVAFGGMAIFPAISKANLQVTLGNDDISSLSIQLLDEPRSAAGRRKNVWDADPATYGTPVDAISGVHYFLYDFGANGKLLPQGQRPITVTGVAPGPSYDVNCSVLVQTPSQNSGQPFFYDIPQSFDYDGSQANTNLASLGYQELGVLKVNFTPYDHSGYGQIQGELDSSELAYDGLKENGQFVRGNEQLRVFTQTLAGHDNDTLSGTMTTLVPAGFLPDYPTMTFDPGYLVYPGGTVSGANVLSATVTIPEPATLGIAAVAIGIGTSRRRNRNICS